MKYNPVGGKTYILSASIGSTDTTILLQSFLEPVTNTPLTMANMETDIAYATIAPKTGSSEFISFTGVTQNSDGTALLTGVTRGLSKKYPFTSSVAYKLPHSGTATLILSDAPQVFAQYANKTADETITGLWTFSQFPITPATPLATDSVYGFTKLSVAAASPTAPIVVGDNDPRILYTPTSSEKAALVGTQGNPSSTNKYVTQDNVYTAETDQTQTTQNGTIETGMANTTGNKNILCQSFIPAKTKIRGVKLYKAADTGTFTGTVTVGLFADSAGSPTGSALATVTISNTTWLLQAVGEFEALFAAEYSMTAGALYWLKISTSTSDSSNHPNLGTNTAGGYASGSAKYWNTTDGWNNISTIDLYFKTLEGTSNQVPKANSAGKLPFQFLNPAFYQRHYIAKGSADTGIFGVGSNPDGSVMVVLTEAVALKRFERDKNTGQYIMTHSVSTGLLVQPSNGNNSTAVIVAGDYVYVLQAVGGAEGNHRYRRYDLANLANETTMTGTSSEFGITVSTFGFFDPATNFFYIGNSGSSSMSKYTVSGTAFTDSGTDVTFATPNTNGSISFDGTYVYFMSFSAPTVTVTKYTLTGTSLGSRTFNCDLLETGAIGGMCPVGYIPIKDTTEIAYLGLSGKIFIDTASTDVYGVFLHLYPLTKV